MLLPEDKNLQSSYAMALFDAGKYSEASKVLEELRKDPPLLPKAPKVGADDAETDAQAAISNKVSLLMTLGECYVNLDRPLDARDCFQEAVRTQPTNASAFLSLGKACLMTNDLNLVEESAARVLRLDPQNTDAMILQAVVQQKQKKWSESMTTLAGAARIAPKDPTVLCMAGISAIQLGKKDSAVAFFEQALAAHPGDAWAGELLQSIRPAAPAPAPSEASPLSPAEPESASASVDLSDFESFALSLASEAAALSPSTPSELSSATSALSPADALTNAAPSRNEDQ
jgi:cytochrome c-type biogenesis protein CcmH/NrfG